VASKATRCRRIIGEQLRHGPTVLGLFARAEGQNFRSG